MDYKESDLKIFYTKCKIYLTKRMDGFTLWTERKPKHGKEQIMTSEFIPFIVIFLIIIVVCLVLRRNKSQLREEDIDERQQMIRGKALRVAMIVIILIAVLYSCFTYVSDRSYAEDGISVLLLAFIGLAIYSIYAIFHDAFFGLRDRPLRYILITLFVSCANAVGAVRSIQNHELIQNGILTNRSIQLACASLFFVILIAILIKFVIDRREASRADEF